MGTTPGVDVGAAGLGAGATGLGFTTRGLGLGFGLTTVMGWRLSTLAVGTTVGLLRGRGRAMLHPVAHHVYDLIGLVESDLAVPTPPMVDGRLELL